MQKSPNHYDTDSHKLGYAFSFLHPHSEEIITPSNVHSFYVEYLY